MKKQLFQFIILSLLLGLIACTSRLKTNLFVEHNSELKKVKVEQTQLVHEAKLTDPFVDQKIIAGDGNIALITISTRWGENVSPAFSDKLLAFDHYWKARLYFELPADLKAQKLEFKENSLMHLMGHFNWKPEQKIFLPHSGYYTIDSLNSDKLFITVEGEFKNQDELIYKLSGNYKIKVK